MITRSTLAIQTDSQGNHYRLVPANRYKTDPRKFILRRCLQDGTILQRARFSKKQRKAARKAGTPLTKWTPRMA